MSPLRYLDKNDLCEPVLTFYCNAGWKAYIRIGSKADINGYWLNVRLSQKRTYARKGQFVVFTLGAGRGAARSAY